MEIKLTADWIILHDSEVYVDEEGKGCFRIFDSGFQYHLIELALKTLNVKYECNELYDESDVDYKSPTYYYTFENIEDIKDPCPELYNEFQKQIKEKEETNVKPNDNKNKADIYTGEEIIYRVIEGSEEWDYMWNKLAKESLNIDDPHPTICENDGECWQYMDTSEYEGELAHCFRHRYHPITKEKLHIFIKVSPKFNPYVDCDIEE